MTLLTFERAHALGLERAREVAQRIGDEMRSGYGVDSTWQGDTLLFSRTGLSGELRITSNLIRLEAKLGFLFSSFKPRIEAALTANFDRYFSGPDS